MLPFDSNQLLLKPEDPTPDLQPQANCFCGSEKSFVTCCGSTEILRPPPVGLCMFENYLDQATVKELVAYADTCPSTPMAVIDNKSSAPDNLVVTQDARRIAGRVNLGERHSDLIELVKTSFIELAARCFDAELDWFESPELMRYCEGGHYSGHADSENIDSESGMWRKIMDRDLSLLLYLNDDFEGGELSFYKLRYQVWPRAGAAVMFPSDHRFFHQAEKVTKGTRYAIVSWASVKGMPKIASQPPRSAILLNNRINGMHANRSRSVQTEQT